MIQHIPDTDVLLYNSWFVRQKNFATDGYFTIENKNKSSRERKLWKYLVSSSRVVHISNQFEQYKTMSLTPLCVTLNIA